MTPSTNDVHGDPLDDLAGQSPAAEAIGLAYSVTPPDRLRSAVLDAARSARPPGRPTDPAEVIGAPEALRRSLRDLAMLVAGITPAEAEAPAIEGWTVAGLLGHLTMIEEHFGAVVGWWPEGHIPDEHDHLGMTVPGALAAQALPFSEVVAAWTDAVDRILERLGSLDGRLRERVRLHGFDFSVRSALTARTFEVWTHTEDICRALGRPLPELDLARLRLMTATAVSALPVGMLLSGRESGGRSVRIVLEGPGGGSWVQALDLGAPPGEPVLTLVADAVAFCRVAGRRLRPAELACTVVGDVDLASDVLASVAVFAA